MFSNVFRYIDELNCSEELEEIIQSAKDRGMSLLYRGKDC